MTGSERRRPQARTVRTAAALLAVLVVLALGAAALLPARSPGLRHTSVLNVLFDNRWMVGGTRTLALAVGVYLLGSIVVRVTRDQWLRHVGPVDVETEETIKRVTQDQAELQDALDSADATIERLRHEYAVLLAERGGSGQTGVADGGSGPLPGEGAPHGHRG